VATDRTIVHIETETDTPNGWSFAVNVRSNAVDDRTITLRMGWADFEHWSAGAVPPSAVARAVVELALERKPDSVNLGDFDAAMLRRWFPGADEALQNKLNRSQHD